jgi:hypothetical protein
MNESRRANVVVPVEVGWDPGDGDAVRSQDARCHVGDHRRPRPFARGSEIAAVLRKVRAACRTPFVPGRDQNVED